MDVPVPSARNPGGNLIRKGDNLEGGGVDLLDPWQVHECEPDPVGCSFVFSDPEYEREGRDTLYYARAVEAPTAVVNGGGLRCERDADGRCTGVDVCGLDGDSADDCLGEAEPKAWSSPIFVDWVSEPG